MNLPSLICSLVVALLLLVSPRAAQGQDQSDGVIEACFSAYEETQVHLKKKQYEKAREVARSCSEGCPDEIAEQCTKWAWEAERDAPSVLLVARLESGEDAPGVAARIDGEWKPLQKEVLLDPGTHMIAFSREDGWKYSIRVKIHPGEKRRTIRAAVPNPEPKKPTVAEPPPPKNTHVPWAVASFAVGAVGFSVAGVFTGVALNRKATLEDCAPTCRQEEVDRAQSALTVADVGLIVGAVGTATGLGILIWGKPKPQAQRTSVGVFPTPGGLQTMVRAHF